MSRLTDPARLQKEIEAQKKRAEALALLSSSGGERHFKPGEIRKARDGKDGDNTLEVVTLRKAQQTYLEQSAKERLLQQQNSVREGVQRKQAGGGSSGSGGDGGGGGAGGPLPEGWKEIKDPNSGSTYFWNKSSNATSWVRPVVPPHEAPEPERGGAGKGGGPGPAGSGPGESSSRSDGGVRNGGGSAASSTGEGGGDSTPPPLPAGWKEIKDPKSGGVYFWNKAKGATTWVRPTGPASGGSADGGAASGGGSTPGLPEGWKAVTHAATGQTHYVHEASGKRSFTLPGSEPPDASSSSGQRQRGREGRGGHAGGGGGGAASSARSSEGRNRGDSNRPKKKGRGSWEIDPLDPTGKTGGKWSDGLVQVGERMADSTASGPLWQQRPYPAPGKILRGRTPTDAETAGPRQR
ncbi:unnamed protein product [Ectocarpus sp. 6 AP-2014]